MIGLSGIAGIQTNLAGLQAAARTSWGAPTTASSSARWPEIRDIFRFSPYVSSDPLVENAIARAVEPPTPGEKKTVSMIDRYRKWLQGSAGTVSGDGWMTMADAVRDRVDLGAYSLLDAARTRSQEVGNLLGPALPGSTSYGGMGDLLAANAAGTIRSGIYTTRARAALAAVA